MRASDPPVRVGDGVPDSGSRADAALEALAPAARRAPPGVRLGVTAAVVLFLAAVAASAIIAFSASGAGDQGVIEADAGPAAAVGDGEASGAAAAGAEVASMPVLVHVAGAVNEPGLVELVDGARVVDAVAAAGGFAATADPAAVNLARVVADGEQLIVPAVGESPPAASGSNGATGAAPAADGMVQLNSAGLVELDTLPRIGPALAQRILDYRETNGPFTSIEQLLDVAGIGDAVFAGLVDRVVL